MLPERSKDDDELLKGCKRPEDLLGDAGLSVRDIRAHLEDLYGLRVSPDLISRGEAEMKTIR